MKYSPFSGFLGPFLGTERTKLNLIQLFDMCLGPPEKNYQGYLFSAVGKGYSEDENNTKFDNIVIVYVHVFKVSRPATDTDPCL